MRRFIGVNLPLGCKINAGHPPGNRQPFAVQRFYSQRSAIKCNNRAAHIQRDLLWGKIQHPAAAIGNNAPGADLQIRQTVKIGVRLAQQVVQGGGRGAAFGPAAWVLLHARPPPFVCRGTHMRGSFTPIYGKGGADMKQKSSQMRFAPWPVVQAALALALSGLLLARPQAAAQGFAAGLKLCGGSLLPALFPLFVVCGLLGPLAPALGWPLRPLMRLCGIRSPRAPAVLVLGWCGGYAVCAQQIAALRKTGELPPRDAALLLLLGCCSGPGFVVGCIGGQLFGSVALGLLLYGLQLAANLAAAACLVLFLPKQELPAGQGSSQQKSVTFPQAINNAVQSSLTVCGCAVFCRVVGSVLGQGMPDGARPYLNAALEISAGCADFAAAGSVAGVCLCLSLLGASVLAQLAALLQGTVPLGLLLAARVLHFMFLQGLLHLCLPLVPGQAAVFTSLAPQVVVMKRTAWDTALAIAFFLCAALYQLYKTC